MAGWTEPPYPPPGWPPGDGPGGYGAPGGYSGHGHGDVGVLAGWWRRVGATVIDAIIIAIPVGVALGLARVTGVTEEVVSGVVMLVYLMAMLGLPRAQTVGNMAVSTRVVDARTGGPPGPGRAAVRALVLLVLEATGIGWIIDVLWPLWDPRKQTLHDKAAGTLVLYTP